MRKFILTTIITMSMICLAACSKDTADVDTKDEAATEAPEAEENTESDEESGLDTTEVIDISEADYKASDYVTLADYKGVSIDVSVDDADIQSQIEQFVATNGKKEVKEGTTKEGDIVNIDFVGKKDGVEFDGGSATDVEYQIGSGQFIEDLDKGLVGFKVGETKDVDVVFPEEYQSEELAGQKAVFTVTVNAIIVDDPDAKFDDAFVEKATNGEYKTAADYKAKLEEDTLTQNKNSMGGKAIEYVVTNSTVSAYPSFLMDKLSKRMDASNKFQAKNNGYDDFEGFITDVYQMTMDDYNARVYELAKQYVREMMIYQAIFEKEGMDVSSEDYDAEVEMYMQQNGSSSKEDLEKYYTDNFNSDLDSIINESVMINKVTEVISSNAVEAENK